MTDRPLNVGDRVRVVKWGGRVFNRAADLTKYNLDGQIGFIFEDDTLGCMNVRLPQLDACISICCLELVKPRRTFEEIVKELGNNKIITDFYCRDQDFPYGDSRDKSCEFFCMDEDEHSYVGFEIFDDGKVRMEEIFTTAELAAISAACSEIAANYQAEHGKEGA